MSFLSFFRHAAIVIIVPMFMAACGKTHTAGPARANATSLLESASPAALLVSSEDVLTMQTSALASGPSITGSLEPERRADLRAEISAVVLEVLKENGDSVRRGDLLVRLDDTAIRDSLTSAEASARAAAQSYEQAERQFQRLAKLREAGMVSVQAVEDAEINRNNAQSNLESARSLAVSARQQLQRTQVRAPFDGVVSDRKVSGGDTAQIGKELIKVIDPRSMRFEGMVSADSIGKVRAGQPVTFRVHGYADREFRGKITRVNPAANTTTRQVEVLVEFTSTRDRPQLAGLYAEGRVETSSKPTLTIPPSAVILDGEEAFAWRLHDNVLRKTNLSLGERHARSGELVVKSGLTEGDQVLRYPSAVLHDGQKVEMSARSPTSSTASAASRSGAADFGE